MRAARITLLAIMLLPFSGCDIFIDSFGEEHMPCWEDNDCQDDRYCVHQTCVTVDTQSGKTHTIDGIGDIRALAMSFGGDNKIWLAAATSVVSGSTYNTQVWMIESTHDMPLVKTLDTDGHQFPVNSMAFLEAKYDLLAADEGGIRRWSNIATTPLMVNVTTDFDQIFGDRVGIWTLAVKLGGNNFGLIDSVGNMASGTGTHVGGTLNTAAFKPLASDTTFVTAGKNISEWVCEQTDCSSIVESRQPVQFSEGQITSVSYHAGGQILAAVLESTDLNELKILDENFEVLDWWDSNESGFTTLVFSPADNRWLAVGRYDGALEIWNCQTDTNIHLERVLHRLDAPVDHITFSPSGQYLVASSGDTFVLYDAFAVLPQQDY